MKHLNVVGIHKFEFQELAAGVVNYSITPCKLGALLAMGTGATTVAGIFTQVRVLKLAAWSPTPIIATANPSNVAIAFNSALAGLQGDEQANSGMSMGTGHNGFACIRPKLTSQAGQFQNTNVNNASAQNTLFTITSPAQSLIVIQITLEYRCTITTRAAAASSFTVGAASAGTLYYMALDNAAGGTASSSSNLIPTNALVFTS